MSSAIIRIHPADNVVIARRQLLGGTAIEAEHFVVQGLVPPGHKVAVRAISVHQMACTSAGSASPAGETMAGCKARSHCVHSLRQT